MPTSQQALAASPETARPSSASDARPWLSILIPVYNVEDYLTACIESVMSQLDPAAGPVEVLAVDDVSTDGSARLLQTLCARHSALQACAHDRNRGLSAARNTLLDRARGDYIWFLDSDDLLMPGAIAGLKAIADRHSPDLVMCDFRVVRERMSRKHVWRGELHRTTFAGPAEQLLTSRHRILDGLLLTGQLHSWSKIARRRVYGDDIRFPEGRYYEDMATTPRLALKAESAWYAPSVWVGYRQRAGSILSTLSTAKLHDLAVCWPEISSAAVEALGSKANAGGGLSRFLARSFIGAARSVGRQPLHARHIADQLQPLRSAFDRALVPLGRQPRQLPWRLLATGWPWRALRLAYWLERTRRARGHGAR
ncbi:glycosyl transferase family 2 [Comamonas sp. BIGb0124]|uniref:glycosyltransferase family 2 protein n=1 Tax=Comamonas sp. BIGb0124 TaxID=2485130 RepID=UPI000F4A7F73|nr:glycosyltransferase family 2 protein [Comamonas sp. BIGb0124]ROR21682.1 glycosyl transferase family 2 [Comamonas sp. BIGb0124]